MRVRYNLSRLECPLKGFDMASERIDSAIVMLNAAREQLNAALDGVSEGLWEQQIYSEGAQWTLRQLLIHLMLADHGQTNVLMGIAEGKNLIPEDYDINRYNAASVSKRQAVTVEEARDGLAQSRARLIDWLHQIDASVLDKEGRHPTLLIMSIDQILGLMARHEAAHTADIEALMARHA